MNVASIVKAKGSRIVATQCEPSIQRPSAGRASAQILHMHPTSPRVWGLSPAERILRDLRRADIAGVVVPGTAAPSCEYRTSVAGGKRGSVRVNLGCRRNLNT